MNPTDIGGIDLYAYHNNDPVNYFDPSGRLVATAIVLLLIATGAIVGDPVGGGIALSTVGGLALAGAATAAGLLSGVTVMAAQAEEAVGIMVKDGPAILKSQNMFILKETA